MGGKFYQQSGKRDRIDAHAQAKCEVGIDVWCKLMGLRRTFEAGVRRDVEVAYGVDARHGRFR